MFRQILVVLCLCYSIPLWAQSINPSIFIGLQTAREAQDRGAYAEAEKILKGLDTESGSLEEVLVMRSRGYLAWAKGDVKTSLGLLEKVYASGQLGKEEQANERMNLARLNLSEGRFARVVELLKPLQRKASEEQLKMLVQSYQGLGQYSNALPLAERFVSKHPKADDSWLQLLVAGNYELKRYSKAEVWQKRLLVRHFSDSKAWWQLAGLQQMAGAEERALATLRTARHKGVRFTARELDNLTLLSNSAGQPWQGARLLEGMLEAKLLKTTPARQERLASLWWQALDRKKAAAAYKTLASNTGQAKHWLSYAQLELEQQRWKAGLNALAKAEKSGASSATVRSWRDWANAELARSQGGSRLAKLER